MNPPRRQLYIDTAENALLWLLAEAQVDDEFRTHKAALLAALATVDSLRKPSKSGGSKTPTKHKTVV